jgi:hypothetical protein
MALFHGARFSYGDRAAPLFSSRTKCRNMLYYKQLGVFHGDNNACWGLTALLTVLCNPYALRIDALIFAEDGSLVNTRLTDHVTAVFHDMP